MNKKISWIIGIVGVAMLITGLGREPIAQVTSVARAVYSTFRSLRDTPASYSGEGGKYVRVASGEDEVEFTDELVGSTLEVDSATVSGPITANSISTLGAGGSTIYYGLDIVDGFISESNNATW